MDLSIDLKSFWVVTTFLTTPLCELVPCEASITELFKALSVMSLYFLGKIDWEWRILQLLLFGSIWLCLQACTCNNCFQYNEDKASMYLAFCNATEFFWKAIIVEILSSRILEDFFEQSNYSLSMRVRIVPLPCYHSHM